MSSDPILAQGRGAWNCAELKGTWLTWGGGREGDKQGRSEGPGDQEQDETNKTDSAYVPVQF